MHLCGAEHPVGAADLKTPQIERPAETAESVVERKAGFAVFDFL